MRYLVNFCLALLGCSVMMSVLSGAYLLISKLLKNKQSAVWRYAAWWLLGLGFLIPNKPALLGRPLYEFGRPEHIAYYELMPDGSYEYAGTFTENSIGFSTPEIWLMLIWTTGFVVMMFLTLRRQIHFIRSMKRLRQPADAVTQTMLELTCIDLDIQNHVEIYTLPVIVSPMMTGLFRPCILLPEQEYQPEELRLIIKHELVHYRHGDLWCKLLWMVCRMLHWFNPFMPVLMRRMEQDCEMACDETVMRNESDETAGVYCNSILETALHQVRTGRQTPVLATNFSGSKDMLRDRMNSVLTRGQKRKYVLIIAGIALLTVLTGQLFAQQRSSEIYAYDDLEEAYESSTPYPADGIIYETEITQSFPTVTTSPMPIPETTYPLTELPVRVETTAPAAAVGDTPVMTTVIIGNDGMIYAVSAYSQPTAATTATIPAYVTSGTDQ